MSELITVPTFNYSQGDVFDGAEPPVTVCYYNNGDVKLVELTQDGNRINFTSIAELKSLVKLVEKHLPKATKSLDNK